MDPDPGSALDKNESGSVFGSGFRVFLPNFTEFFDKAEISDFSYLFAKTLWTIQKLGNFYYLLFYLGFESKNIFFDSFWLILCPSDPGSQNIADPDPEHS